MNTQRLQSMLPPGMSAEAEEKARKLLEALDSDSVLIDFVALKAADKAFRAICPFPVERLDLFNLYCGRPPSPDRSWEDFEDSLQLSIEEMASSIIIDEVENEEVEVEVVHVWASEFGFEPGGPSD